MIDDVQPSVITCQQWGFVICIIQLLMLNSVLCSPCNIQLSAAVRAAQHSELTHSVTATVTKVTTREKMSAVRQTRESPPPQKKRQVVVDSELRKRCVYVPTLENMSVGALFISRCLLTFIKCSDTCIPFYSLISAGRWWTIANTHSI